MRVIVTGGTGLIGRALAASLLNDGHEVVVLTRDATRAAKRLPAGAHAHAWDARSAKGWARLAEGSDAIINLAGESIAGEGLIPARWTKARKERIWRSRIDAGRAVVEAVEAASRKPAVLIQASAIGYYGQHQHDGVFTEDSPPGDDFLARLCAAWEESTQSVEALGVRRAVIRTGLVLSMDGGTLPFMALQHKLFVGGRLGSGRQWYSWIHIADEVAAIRFLLENADARGPFNLTAPNPVTNQDFSRILAQTLHRPAFLVTPPSLMRLALGEIATLALEGQRVVPKRLLELGFTFRFADLASALADLLS
ncbi:MAG: TIGR01777 family protein [Chloroflexi bacterium]|nr:TIGR01777 family protein [Chloroflexota bacterium]